MMKTLSIITCTIVIMAFLLLDASYNIVSGTKMNQVIEITEQAKIENDDKTNKPVERNNDVYQVVGDKIPEQSKIVNDNKTKKTNEGILESDASDHALAATLSQDGRPVAFFSRRLTDCEKRHSSVEKEANAIVEAVRKWKHFLIGQNIDENMSMEQKDDKKSEENTKKNDPSIEILKELWNKGAKNSLTTWYTNFVTKKDRSQSVSTEVDINECIASLQKSEEPIFKNNNDNLLYGAFISKVNAENQPKYSCFLKICLNELDEIGFNNTDARKNITNIFNEVEEVPTKLKEFPKMYFRYLKRHEKNTDNKLPLILNKSSFCLSQTCMAHKKINHCDEDACANDGKEKCENASGLDEELNPICVQQVCLGQITFAGYDSLFTANDSIFFYNNNEATFDRQNLFDYDFIHLFTLHLSGKIPQIDKKMGPKEFCSYLITNQNTIAY